MTRADPPVYVSVTLPLCPACHGHDLQTYRSTRDVEGVIRHTRCRSCGFRFRVDAKYLDPLQDLEPLDADPVERPA